MSKTVNISVKRVPSRYEIAIGAGLLVNIGSWTKSCLSPATKKIALVSNHKVYGIYGERARKSLLAAGYKVVEFLIADGERHKNLKTIENLLNFFSENQLKRTDAVFALGGGVVGDLAGFAAAVYLRGVQFLLVPTTLLSQIDSSVGGKTGVNSDYGKNLIGAFYQPSGVLIDTATLQTLPQREWTAGLCEAVKHGAISSRKLFYQTADFLANYPGAGFRKHFADQAFHRSLENLLFKNVSFKAEIVRSDEYEATGRIDTKSRKILNFGHTFAHALEKATDYRYFKHGEAVGYGMLAAAEISKNIGILDQNSVTLLNDVVHRAGRLPSMKSIDPKVVMKAIAFDKKNLGNSMQWVLLEDLGAPKIVSQSEFPDSAVRDAITQIIKASHPSR